MDRLLPPCVDVVRLGNVGWPSDSSRWRFCGNWTWNSGVGSMSNHQYLALSGMIRQYNTGIGYVMKAQAWILLQAPSEQ
jgi:hypothetical protein